MCVGWRGVWGGTREVSVSSVLLRAVIFDAMHFGAQDCLKKLLLAALCRHMFCDVRHSLFASQIIECFHVELEVMRNLSSVAFSLPTFLFQWYFHAFLT